MHVKPLLPSRSTTMLPCASLSMIFADFAMSAGPADIARAIFVCRRLGDHSSRNCDQPSAHKLRFANSFPFMSTTLADNVQ